MASVIPAPPARRAPAVRPLARARRRRLARRGRLRPARPAPPAARPPRGHATSRAAAAQPRPARRARRRAHRRRGGGLEPARSLSSTPPPREFLGRHQLRPGLPRQLRHPGQLQRLPGLGHLQPGAPVAGGRLRLPRLAERRLGLPEPALRLRRGAHRPPRLRHGGGARQAVSEERLRGIRIFDISDIRNPQNVGNVQTCRGSHTHTVLVDPDDRGERLRLRLRLRGRAPGGGAPRLRRRAAERGPELGALPHRGDPGAARAPGAGGDRQLAAHLRATWWRRREHGLAPGGPRRRRAARRRGRLRLRGRGASR